MKPNSKRILRLLPIVFLSGMLIASATTFAAVKDACSVVSAADAQAALGEPVGPPQNEPNSTPMGDGSRCRYRSTQGKAFSAKTVSVSVQYSNTDLNGSVKGITDNLKASGFGNVHTVPGVGSAAIWGTISSVGRPQGELTVIKGKSVMLIILLTGIQDESAALDDAKKLAAIALPKL